jgi:FlaA1/EpsC-like NDP-sugar epimerase
VRLPVNRHRVWQLVVDGCFLALAWFLAFQLRFDGPVPVFYDTLFKRTIGIAIAIKLCVFVLSGFYNRWWRYVSTRDMWSAARGVAVACLVSDLTIYFASPVHELRLPRSIAALDFLLTMAFVAASRMLARTLIERPRRGLVASGREVLVVGAGDAGEQIVREMLRSRALDYTPIGFVDDMPSKRGLRIHGVKVLGTIDDLAHLLRDNRPDEILIAIPSAPGTVRQKVVDVAQAAGVPVKTLPGLSELISGDVHVSQLRPVQVEDVLGRDPVTLDPAEASSYLRGETVLVTGAGGSIGSELCRQIARLGCQRLILVDHGETPLFEIERELKMERGFTACVPVLADVKSRRQMRQRVFERYEPTIVFHAAAYKHVPLMEQNPLEAVRNNALATKAIADVSVEFGVKRFVLVSTDKAANPKTVMGQSKALCEWIVEALGHRQDVVTRVVAVRFGNVLGSSGSVIPIFRRQIARGGPVTVTHPDMTRYFMTIPEAVSLVLQAGAIGGRGEVLVLDMGEPVKIVDLAHNMIRLSGREDIEIVFTGVRAGEKLHEELFGEGEEEGATSHPKIRRAVRAPVDDGWLEAELGELERLVEEGDTNGVVGRVVRMVKAPQRVGASVEEPSRF